MGSLFTLRSTQGAPQCSQGHGLATGSLSHLTLGALALCILPSAESLPSPPPSVHVCSSCRSIALFLLNNQLFRTHFGFKESLLLHFRLLIERWKQD